jgi:hypothetical protein
MTDQQLGEIAYNAYCESRGWKSVRGEHLPHWKEQSQELRDAWARAADAVRVAIHNETAPG